MINRQPLENADTVSLVCALLVRFPELASIRSMPAEGSVRLTFALRARLNKREQAALAETIDDHVNGFPRCSPKMKRDVLRVEFDGDRTTTFHCT